MLNLKTKEHIEFQKSVFQQMYEGTRSNEGSFNCNLYQTFISGGEENRKALITAFPNFFNEHDYYLEWVKCETLSDALFIIKNHKARTHHGKTRSYWEHENNIAEAFIEDCNDY